LKIVEPSVQLLHITPDAEQVIERAGRIAWRSEDRITAGSHEPFIRMIKTKNHESVLEHASAGFIIVTDRGITHELVRHRIASYTQESTRYCNYSKGKFDGKIRVIIPSGLNPAQISKWQIACEAAEYNYINMLNEGAKAQQARSVLPTSLASEVVMTANFREWRHFIRLRTAEGAHPDMRIIAGLIRKVLREQAPVVFEDI
jgi:thymidylate synthase (FAD)